MSNHQQHYDRDDQTEFSRTESEGYFTCSSQDKFEVKVGTSDDGSEY